MLALNVNKIIALDHSENGLWKLKMEIENNKDLEKKVEYKLISLLQLNFLNSEIFKKYKIDYIFHAAAYKHVNLVEDNITTGFVNNVSFLNLLEAIKNLTKNQKLF